MIFDQECDASGFEEKSGSHPFGSKTFHFGFLHRVKPPPSDPIFLLHCEYLTLPYTHRHVDLGGAYTSNLSTNFFSFGHVSFIRPGLLASCAF